MGFFFAQTSVFWLKHIFVPKFPNLNYDGIL